MKKPLTAAQAIEIRQKWLDAQWHKKFPKGEWRVVKTPHHVVIAFYTRRTCARYQKSMLWESMPPRTEPLHPYMSHIKDYPPIHNYQGAYVYTRSFTSEAPARAKYNQLCKGAF